MSQHQQWVPVTAEGAAPQPGFRCDGCGQVKWQAEPPVEACELCADTVPTPATIAAKQETDCATVPPADVPAVVLQDPAPSPTIEEPCTESTISSDLVPPKPAPERRPRSRNPGLSQEDK